MFSCIFNQSSKALGVGVDILNIFNKLTIVSLFDAKAIQTIGMSSVDTSFVPGLIILAAIAIVTYVIGAVKLCMKDLPL